MPSRLAMPLSGLVWYDPATQKGVVVIVVWDDWGKAFDHVPPPGAECPKFSRGFRVPLLIVSPFAAGGTLAGGGKMVTESASFGAIPKLIEDVFTSSQRLPAPARDDSYDGDLLSALDFSGPRIPVWTDLARASSCSSPLPLAGNAA